MKLPQFLYDRFDRDDKLPRWAMFLWPRMHWCGELDGLLVDGCKDDYYCECVKWPIRWKVARECTPWNPADDDELFADTKPKPKP